MSFTGARRARRQFFGSTKSDGRPRAGGPRFLLYSHDALGLGHVRRNLVIAGALVRTSPEASVLLATSAEHADSLGVPEGVDLLRLPALRKVDNERYTARRLSIPAPELTALRGGLLEAAVESYRPSVLLADKQPLGVGGELERALHALRRRGGRAVLGLRDVLDDPVAVRAEWTPKRLRRVLEHYPRVLVYGNESALGDLAASTLPSGLAERATYCGYVTRPPAGDADAARTIRGFGGARTRPIVLATTGGGEDGLRVLETFVEASEGERWEALAVAGPQLAAGEARRLRARASAAGVAVRTFVPELAGWFGVVDALVCMGGYNTLSEALVRGTPTVCVPRTVPRTEQLIRARSLEALGLLQAIAPYDLDPATLRHAIEVALTRSRPAIARDARRALRFDGAENAARCLLEEAARSRVEEAA